MTDATLTLASFGDPTLASDDLLARLAWLRDVVRPRLERYLGYYRNPTSELAAVLPCAARTSFAIRPFRQYQELGLPARITGFRRAADGLAVPTGSIEVQRKEVVIENDIGWRINTLVDFAAGRMPAITSTAKDSATRQRLTAIIGAILDSAGGVQLLQELVLHGAIRGSAWVHLRPTAELLRRLATRAAAALNQANTSSVSDADISALNEEVGEAPDGSGPENAPADPDNASTAGPASIGDSSLDVARWLQFEVIDAGRLCPLPYVGDTASSEEGPAYVALLRLLPEQASLSARNGVRFLDRVWSWFGRPLSLTVNPQEFSFDLFGGTHWQRYEHGLLLEEGPNLLGVLPFVRYENQSDPSAGTRVGALGSEAIDSGFSDVEPLIGLQDELNTRLSDRAYRVTMTSFQMFLGRGIEEFTKRPVGPGQMWATENLQASVQAFGGDATTPSEDSHINEIREALDKISGVTPIAAGVIRDKLGHLTSAVALRLTLIALLARTERKRAELTRTLSRVIERALGILDRAGLVASAPEDRGIDVNWPSALPESDMDHLQEAQVKLALGVPRSVILSELGYAEVLPEVATPSRTTSPSSTTAD
ncbi:MAG TPA: phage portal protein [Phycisphaerae bacterium]|nr:phage portal protein [Phycisphaerae bacterium]